MGPPEADPQNVTINNLFIILIGDNAVKKIDRFVIWICSKFTRSEIEHIIKGLSDILANRNPEVKPKDDFKEKHPNYCNFFVDPEPPITTSPKPTPKLNWKNILSNLKKTIKF